MGQSRGQSGQFSDWHITNQLQLILENFHQLTYMLSKNYQQTLYRQRERRQKFIEIVAIILAGLIATALLGGLVYWGMARRGIV